MINFNRCNHVSYEVKILITTAALLIVSFIVFIFLPQAAARSDTSAQKAGAESTKEVSDSAALKQLNMRLPELTNPESIDRAQPLYLCVNEVEGGFSKRHQESHSLSSGFYPPESEVEEINGSSNIEATLNLVANFTEILGISALGSFFFGMIVAFSMRRSILGFVLLTMCPLAMVGGLSAPGVLNWLYSSVHESGLTSIAMAEIAMAAVANFLFVAVLMVMGLLPAILAFRNRSSCRWAILGANAISWLIPLGWPALLWWSLDSSQPDYSV